MGALHALCLPADLFDQAGVTEVSYGPFTSDDGMSTVNVATPQNDLRNKYGHRHGASLRLSCEIDDAAPSFFYELPGGQRHQRGDRFYENLLPSWLAHLPAALPFGVRDVIDLSVDTIKVQSGAIVRLSRSSSRRKKAMFMLATPLVQVAPRAIMTNIFTKERR